MVEVKRTLRHSLWICWKDLLEITRNKMGMVMLVLMPLLMMVMIGFIFPSTNSLQDTKVAVANLDGGVYGNAFVSQLELMSNQTGMMKLCNATDFEEIKAQIQEGSISGGIIISENFTADLLEGKQGNITIVTDQTNPQMSLMMENLLTNIIEQMGIQYAMVNLSVSYTQIVPYNVQIGGIVPGESSYFQFMAPGIMAMVVMMALMTGLPHAISYEKDMGTLDGMLVAPIGRLSIILGKTLAQVVRGMIQGIILLLLAIFMFGVVIYGSVLLVFLILFLGVFSFVGLGILITSFTNKEETATMIMMTIMFPMMFFSGVFFPIQQMPEIMQVIAQCLPLTYATTALRKVIILGAGLPAISLELLFLIVFGVVLLVIAIPMFKKAMSR
ncbi:MAG: ABC transporter permease [Candidatus Helarchaeota archaeon]